MGKAMKLNVLAVILSVASLAMADDWGFERTPTPSLDEIFTYSVPTDISVGSSLETMSTVTETDREYMEIQRDKQIYNPQNQPNYNPFIGSESVTGGAGSAAPNYNAFLGESLDREAYELYQNVFGADASRAASESATGSYFLKESSEAPMNVFLSR